MIGYVFALLGYPFCVALTGSLFSKVLGPIPQVKHKKIWPRICIRDIFSRDSGWESWLYPGAWPGLSVRSSWASSIKSSGPGCSSASWPPASVSASYSPLSPYPTSSRMTSNRKNDLDQPDSGVTTVSRTRRRNRGQRISRPRRPLWSLPPFAIQQWNDRDNIFQKASLCISCLQSQALL